MIWMLLILLLPLVALLYRPVWFRPETNQQSEENLRLYQERTDELKSSELNDAEQAALQLELDREFLASADGHTSRADKTSGSWIMLGGMVVVALLASVMLYSIWGADNALRASALLNKGEQVELTMPERQQLMQRLAAEADHDPDNLEWAYLNARLLNASGEYQQAVDAFGEILEALPEDAVSDRAATLTLMAEAKFFAADQQADEATYALLDEALSLNPQSRQALGMAGILAFELGKHERAINHWKALWQGLPEGPESQVLAQGIRRAAEQLATQDIIVDLAWLERVGLTVAVDISAEARAAVKPDDLVFVLARAVTGPPLPLAVQRLTVADLPTQVTLTDAQAMAPGMTISDFEQLTLIARVSRTGQPTAQPGDWQDERSPVDHRDSEVQMLTIKTQVN
ncbi:c-type cytochrome biogenesis protein CcmI [Oceanobacter sp. 5_MG-2023]|uniref:c-type cytochrome biogenesis protein CcmI n=1 Tax=Oceanobacter sp. 5_MG-2023 TaxID=3062645 RepID=UPI0026E41C72|nr:c-type cytochrome biogenesis protein CcmI [Oceanobacter sp. 5_MG-2023]MDO6682517.1 c-type cytochrome biogenesis protein CcmI [Oceanobacter sp. 5_MG-2023]